MLAGATAQVSKNSQSNRSEQRKESVVVVKMSNIKASKNDHSYFSACLEDCRDGPSTATALFDFAQQSILTTMTT